MVGIMIITLISFGGCAFKDFIVYIYIYMCVCIYVYVHMYACVYICVLCGASGKNLPTRDDV